MNPHEYVTDAIYRIRAGEVSSEYGSHLAGVFGKAAQQFEEHMRHLLAQVLKASRFSYETELRPAEGEASIIIISLQRTRHKVARR
jgi:hypothetical protein